MLSLLLVACSTDLPFVTDGSVVTEDTKTVAGDPCTYAEEVVGADDDRLGFTASAVAEWIGVRAAELVYRDATTTPMVFQAAIEGDVLYQTSAPVEADTHCPEPRLSIPLAMAFVTDDGVFDAAWVEGVRLESFDPAGPLYLGPYLSPEEVGGSFDHPGMTELSLAINLQPDSSAGEVVAVSEVGEEVATGECGIAAWNMPLQTGC